MEIFPAVKILKFYERNIWARNLWYHCI